MGWFLSFVINPTIENNRGVVKFGPVWSISWSFLIYMHIIINPFVFSSSWSFFTGWIFSGVKGQTGRWYGGRFLIVNEKWSSSSQSKCYRTHPPFGAPHLASLMYLRWLDGLPKFQFWLMIDTIDSCQCKNERSENLF